MIKVWGRTNSLNVQKVLWTLAELGLAFERRDAGMKFGVVDTPAYRALNPNGLVPTIEDDGFVLWESNVIVRYLATRHGLGTLCPDDLKARFRAERWMDWQQTSLNPAITPVFVNLIRTPPERRDAAAVARSAELAEGWLALLDAELAGSDYLAGDRLTIADIPAGVSVNRWYRLPIERRAHPHVAAWLARLKARPGFAAHVDQPLS
jgi:glutathione S-transferase